MIPLAVAVDSYLTNLSEDALRQLEGVPEADLNHWKPSLGLEDINTFFALATHLVGAGEYWMLHAAAGRPIERNRPAEFQAVGTLAELELRYKRWLEQSRAILESLTESDLARIFERGGDDPARMTVAECIVHAVEHSAEHLGHLHIQRQIWNAEHRNM